MIEPGSSYKLHLSPELIHRGIHPVYHASLLWPHIPNDNCRFQGCQLEQMTSLGGKTREWAVDSILSHKGHGPNVEFQLHWSTGDVTWAG